LGTSSKDTTRYEFGNFRLDVEHNLLYRMEELLEPERRELALIRLLVENHPRTLTRQELMDALWPRQEVTDAALAQLVRRTRHLLGDNGRSPHYIKTVHGIGLRLIPQPHPLREAATDPLPEDHRFNRKAVEGPVRIGILPFVNHSGDSANDWVETALPQMLGQLLGENPDLLVVEAEQLQGYMLDNEISVEHFDDPQQREKPAQLLEDTGCHLLLHARLEAKFLPRILTCRVISREGPFVPFRVEAPDILAAGSKLANRVIALADPAQPWVVDARQTYSTNRSANQAYASVFTNFVLHTNRTGFEDGVTFWGGSTVYDPDGNLIAHGPYYEEALVTVRLDLNQIRRTRTRLPLLRDERVGLTTREMERILQ